MERRGKCRFKAILSGQIGCFSGHILALTIRRHKGPSLPQRQPSQIGTLGPSTTLDVVPVKYLLTFTVASSLPRENKLC